MNYLNTFDVLHQFQSGFRCGHWVGEQDNQIYSFMSIYLFKSYKAESTVYSGKKKLLEKQKKESNKNITH